MTAALRSSLAALGLEVLGDDAAWAAFSPCGKYRYALGRSWRVPLFPQAIMLFVLHNPSTADHAKDDPTLRRCVAFAKREGCDQVLLVNRFAYRSTDKGALVGIPDAVGELNDAAVRLAFDAADMLVFAWGKVDHRIEYVPAWQHNGLTRHCLGKNGDGSPRHPLYLADKTRFVVWP